MNLLTVGRVACGLGRYLVNARARAGASDNARVVVGYDARHQSTAFAQEAAGRLAGFGHELLVLPRPLPTPVLAYAVRALDADAGIMVTASHNPACDNGIKVYLGGCLTDSCGRGAQIAPPVDEHIQRCIDEVSREPGSWPWGTWTVLSAAIEASYVAAVVGLVPPAEGTVSERREHLPIAFTPLHGVGGETALAVLNSAGFSDVHVVPEQYLPDPDFPTVASPNPEEDGAMDLVTALARDRSAAIAIALDPDADRCAVATRIEGTWTRLHGDQVGCLLGENIAQGLATGPPPAGVEVGKPTFASSIVSSRLLASIAARYHLPHRTTLTGFKWLARVPNLAYAYEEALGLCVAPEVVRDKDGISAALVIAELASLLSVEQQTLSDALDSLNRLYGVHLTRLMTARPGPLEDASSVVTRIAAEPPPSLGGASVVMTEDLRHGLDHLPPFLGVRITTATGARIIVRPSGTENKIKVYLEVIRPRTDALTQSRKEARDTMERLATDVAAMVFR
jgi:phosphomannomutase